jgi:hypothetical protein
MGSQPEPSFRGRKDSGQLAEDGAPAGLEQLKQISGTARATGSDKRARCGATNRMSKEAPPLELAQRW